MWYQMIVYLFIQYITPGPNDLTCLYLGGRYGLWGTRNFIIGSQGALFVKTILCGALNILLARVMPQIVSVLKWFGAAYMLYLAYLMGRSGWEEELSMAGQQKESSIRAGVMLQLLNAKSWIAGISVFAVYVIPVRTDFGAVVLTAVIYAVIGVICSIIWALFGSAIKGFIEKHKKLFGIVMALTLVYCAISALI